MVIRSCEERERRTLRRTTAPGKHEAHSRRLTQLKMRRVGGGADWEGGCGDVSDVITVLLFLHAFARPSQITVKGESPRLHIWCEEHRTLRMSYPMAPNASEPQALTAVSNWTDPCNDTMAWGWVYSAQPVYMAVIFVLGAVGNAFVVCVLCLQRKHRTVADVYLCNLASADLLLVSCLPFWAVTVSLQFHWPFGTLLCKLVNMAISASYFCSVLSLVLVSVDRYLALARPLSFGRRRGVARARRLCLAAWAVGLALGLPALPFRTVHRFPELGVEACYLDFPNGAWRVQRNVTANVVGFLVPVPVLAFCSHRIVTALGRGRARGAGLGAGLGAERKATRLVLVVFAVFILCWLPHQLMRFLDTLDYFQMIPGCLWGYMLDIGTQVSTYLAYGNSALNPLLYVLVGKHFRNRARAVFRHLLARDTRNKSSLTIHLTSTVRHNESTKVSLEHLKIQFSDKL